MEINTTDTKAEMAHKRSWNCCVLTRNQPRPAPPRRKAQIDQENAARGGTVPEATVAPETTPEPDTPENTALPSDGEEDVEITLVFHD